MSWIYILVLCLAIYYIVARYLEKYVENFDPSLVPVSSIVTLAKVAQKLVDGGGTLTNPGNLTIGTPENKGNLVVTGTTNLVGATTVGSTLGVTGNTTVGGTLGVTGATTVGGILAVTSNTTVGGTLGVTGAATVGGTLGVTSNTTVGGTLGVTGNSTLGGTLDITGNTVIKGKLTVGPTTGAGFIVDGANTARLTWFLGGDTIINTNETVGTKVSGWQFNDTKGNPSGVNISMSGTINTPNLNVGQTLTVVSRNGQQGYALYSQTADYFGIWRNGDLFRIYNDGGIYQGSNYPTVVRKYSGACDGTQITINFPKCAYKYDLFMLSSDTNGYCAQTGVMNSDGNAKNLLSNGDPQIRAPHSNTQLAIKTYGSGNWFLTLDCYLF